MQFKPIIKTEFEAYINSIEFNHEDIYKAVCYILDIRELPIV